MDSRQFANSNVKPFNAKSDTITIARTPASMTTITMMATPTATIISTEPTQSTESTVLIKSLLSQVDKEHPDISFIIPNHHDNQHIDNIMNFQQLIKPVNENTIYDIISKTTPTIEQDRTDLQYGLINTFNQNHNITHEQISKSVVLDMTDIHEGSFNSLERFFGNTDMHIIINYLWLATVITLIVLSIIFIVFSCYFYRKFRIWKKCNKDIRSQLNNNNNNNNNNCRESTEPYNGTINPGTIYYQMESPPCYTIATGLPSYDEAIYRNQNYHQQYERHHHHHHQHQHQQQQQQQQHYQQHKDQHQPNGYSDGIHLAKTSQQQSSYFYGFKLIYPSLPFLHSKTSNIINTLNKYKLRKDRDWKFVKSYNVKPVVKQLQPQCQQTQANILNDYKAANSYVALLTDCPSNCEMDNATAQTVLNVTEHFSTNSNDYEISNLYNLSDIISV